MNIQFYNNWRQHDELVFFDVSFRYSSGGIMVTLGFLGFGLVFFSGGA